MCLVIMSKCPKFHIDTFNTFGEIGKNLILTKKSKLKRGITPKILISELYALSDKCVLS